MPDEKRREKLFPPVEPSALPPFDPYNPGPLPGKPLTDEQLNRVGDFAVCRGKHGGHRFGEDGLCEGCPMTFEEYQRLGGIVF